MLDVNSAKKAELELIKMTTLQSGIDKGGYDGGCGWARGNSYKNL